MVDDDHEIFSHAASSQAAAASKLARLDSGPGIDNGEFLMEAFFSSANLASFMALLIPILGVLMPVAIVLLVLHYRHRRTEALLETVKHLADKGQPIPAELFRAPKSAEEPRSERATVMTVFSIVGAGIGLMVFFGLSGMTFLVGIGALVTIVGVAQLIALWLTRHKSTPPDDTGRGL
ncbi:MAG: DUF6249 domain-containing protein [Caldimonas sp.]